MPTACIDHATKAKTKTILCAIYTRKSTDENLDNDFNSLDSQREYCQSFVKSREGEGWRVYPEEYNDPGFSGGNMDRPGLKKLLADVRQGKFQVVVCYKYDRLSRNTKDFLHILEIFDKHAAAFVSVTQPIDTTSSVGRLMRSILMDFAQFEREMISERTRDKMAAMAKKGKWFGGHPILGFDIDAEGKGLRVNEEEAKQVIEMFNAYLKTKSLGMAARFLNEKGIRMKCFVTKKGTQKGGAKFNRMTLDNLLRNPVYIGKIRYHEHLYQGEHSAIIDENLFNAVNALLTGNDKGRFRRPNGDENRHHFLLRGLVRCARCGHSMGPNFAYSKGRKFFYYKCLSVTKMDKTACVVRSVPAGEIERFVLERLDQLSREHGLVDRIVERARSKTGNELPGKREEYRLAQAEMGRIQVEEANYAGILAKEGVQSKAYGFVIQQIEKSADKKKEVQEKLQRAEMEIQRLESQQIDAEVIRRNFTNFQNVFGKLNPGEQNELLRLLIKEIIYDGVESKMKITYRPLPGLPWGQGEDGNGFDYCKEKLPGEDSNLQPSRYKNPWVSSGLGLSLLRGANRRSQALPPFEVYELSL